MKGSEIVTIRGIGSLSPGAVLTASIAFADGSTKEVPLRCRIDTLDELNYFKSGGILHYVLRNLAAA
jgi:aconitate hydratase